jgi:hypothetical protein
MAPLFSCRRASASHTLRLFSRAHRQRARVPSHSHSRFNMSVPYFCPLDDITTLNVEGVDVHVSILPSPHCGDAAIVSTTPPCHVRVFGDTLVITAPMSSTLPVFTTAVVRRVVLGTVFISGKGLHVQVDTRLFSAAAMKVHATRGAAFGTQGVELQTTVLRVHATDGARVSFSCVVTAARLWIRVAAAHVKFAAGFAHRVMQRVRDGGVLVLPTRHARRRIVF